MNTRFLSDDHIVLKQHRALNTLHTWLLTGGSLALLAVTAWSIAGITGIIYAMALGSGMLIAARRVSPAMVLRMYKARPVTEHNFPAGYRLIHELARRGGLPIAPKLHVIPSKMMNAFAVGRRGDSAIAVTDALVRNLTLRELAGVLAHEVTHIRNEDIKVMSLADMVSRMTSTLSTVGILALLFNLTGFFGQVPWLGVLAMIAAPTVGGLLQLALSRTREFDADYGAAMLTGDPDGLSMALLKLERAQGRRWEGMVMPGSRLPDPSMLRSHPRTEDRIARLTALKGAMTNPPVAATAVEQPAPLKTGRSPVPRIPLGRRRTNDHFGHWMALASEPPEGKPVLDEPERDMPASGKPLNPWESEGDRPRVRLRRGGAWW
jgi:heat shock protein HtpX